MRRVHRPDSRPTHIGFLSRPPEPGDALPSPRSSLRPVTAGCGRSCRDRDASPPQHVNTSQLSRTVHVDSALADWSAGPHPQRSLVDTHTRPGTNLTRTRTLRNDAKVVLFRWVSRGDRFCRDRLVYRDACESGGKTFREEKDA